MGHLYLIWQLHSEPLPAFSLICCTPLGFHLPALLPSGSWTSRFGGQAARKNQALWPLPSSVASPATTKLSQGSSSGRIHLPPLPFPPSGRILGGSWFPLMTSLPWEELPSVFHLYLACRPCLNALLSWDLFKPFPVLHFLCWKYLEWAPFSWEVFDWRGILTIYSFLYFFPPPLLCLVAFTWETDQLQAWAQVIIANTDIEVPKLLLYEGKWIQGIFKVTLLLLTCT